MTRKRNRRRTPRSSVKAAVHAPPPEEPGPATGETEVPKRGRSGRLLEAVLLFSFVYVVYLVSPIVTSGDSRFVIPMDLSILRHGDANIDEYSHQFAEAPWAIRTENGHHWNVYPVGVPFLSLPWVWLLDVIKQSRGLDFEAAALAHAPLFEELMVASLFTAAAVALLFLIARKRLPLGSAAMLALAFAFGTPAYSSASRGLWQHGPAMLLMAAVILLYQRLPDWGSPGALALGAVAGFSYAVRPSSALLIVGFAVLVALVSRARFVPAYLVGTAVGLLPMLVFDRVAFGTWTSHYYRLIGSAISIGLPPVKPALAVLVSPSRGLFIFSPFLLLVFLRLLPSVLRRHPFTALEIVLAAACLAWWVGISRFPWWWGGGSYGPRLFSEVAFCIVVLLIPLMEDLSLSGTFRQRLLAISFVLASVVSVAIHFRAATTWPVFEWNSNPVSVDQAPERVWDWRDPQFLRGFAK